MGDSQCIRQSEADVNSDEDDSAQRVGRIFHVVQPDKLKPGDHIYVSRLLYTHHGIYVGQSGKEVIHFSGPTAERNSHEETRVISVIEGLRGVSNSSNFDKEVACIRSCTLAEFLGGSHSIRLVSYKDKCRYKLRCAYRKDCFKSADVLYTALYYLENPKKYPKYHVIFNNCETFATYCKTGKMISKQINGKYKKNWPEIESKC